MRKNATAEYEVYNNAGELIDTFFGLAAAIRYAEKRTKQLCGARHYVKHNGLVVYDS